MTEIVQRIDEKTEALDALLSECRLDLRKTYRLMAKPKTSNADTSDSWIAFGFYDGLNIIGYVEVMLVRQSLYVRTLGVSRVHRRKGIAKKLILGAVSELGDIDRVYLTCIRQTGNAEIFSKMGFVEVNSSSSERFELIDGTTATEVEMELKLN